MDSARKDKETEELELQIKEVKDFTESAGFKHVQTKLVEKIEALMNIAEINDNLLDNPEKFAFEVKVRKAAASLIYEWWKGEVIGIANQHDHINSVPQGKPYIITQD